MTEIAIRIKLLRKEEGLTQQQLGEILNIPWRTLLNWERGQREPNSFNMAKLENFFQVSGSYLRGETDNRQPFSQIEKHQQTSNYLFSDKDIDLMLKLVNKEIMWAERLADTYDLSGVQNTNTKSELMKLAVKLIELKEMR